MFPYCSPSGWNASPATGLTCPSADSGSLYFKMLVNSLLRTDWSPKQVHCLYFRCLTGCCFITFAKIFLHRKPCNLQNLQFRNLIDFDSIVLLNAFFHCLEQKYGQAPCYEHWLFIPHPSLEQCLCSDRLFLLSYETASPDSGHLDQCPFIIDLLSK